MSHSPGAASLHVVLASHYVTFLIWVKVKVWVCKSDYVVTHRYTVGSHILSISTVTCDGGVFARGGITPVPARSRVTAGIVSRPCKTKV